MKNDRRITALALLIIFSMSCSLTGQAIPQKQVTPQGQVAPQVGSAAFSAQANSPASINLKWQPVDGAGGYLLEGQYGGGDFFQVANLTGDQTEFIHFVVPGSSQISYRLSAIKDSGNEEVDSVVVKIPQPVPDPLVVQSSDFAPKIEGIPEMPVLPTLDPLNPDPSAMATAIAEFTGSIPDAGPQVQPISDQKEIGPEGGLATVTDPNGVVYTLELPPGAVSQITTIRLTPIESFSGFPFAGGALGAVQVHPPIPFAGPLKLTITLPSDQALAESVLPVGFVVSSFNHEFSMTPVYAAGEREYHMNVYRGDAFGVATASLDEVVAQAARIPTDPGEHMSQQLAALRAANTDRSLEGELLIAAQVLQGLLQQTQELAALTLPNSGAGLAAPVPVTSIRPTLQGQNAARLMVTIIWSEPVWDFLNQMLPTWGFESIPLENETANAMATWRERIVSDLTQAIKAYMDEHDGCRNGLALYAEALRQLLRTPGTPFRQALASNYRSHYGPPPDLQCEFRLQIARSSIKENIPSQDPRLGDSIRTYGVHSEPWPLELDVQDGRIFLRGPVGTQYDAWEWTFTNCPPTVQLRPFPTSLIWITDLTLVFDDNDRVSDFVLQGVTPDRLGGSGDGKGKTESPEAFKCKLVEVTPGANPTDVWGIAFSSLHNRSRKMDNWVITGEDSYVATDTITGRVEGGSMGQLTEDTTIVLTVIEK
jgi:hypothetical protein